jgi:hypothetical protein
VLSFAALQIKPGEVDHDVIHRFFDVASGMGLEFKSLEPYGTFALGDIRLLRFRTDCAALQKLIPFFQDEQRAYVCPGPSGYRFLTQTTEGKAPITVMQAGKLPGHKRRYHGTLNKFWKRQFG